MKLHHVSETDLALYVSGDLAWWRRFAAGLHMDRCEPCRRRMETYEMDRAGIRGIADGMPEDVDWNRLAAEITANIRVGLAAGECVAPRPRKSGAWGWRPAAVVAGILAVLAGGWWLNMPPAQTQELGHAMRAVWGARGRVGIRGWSPDERGPVVEATSAGIELRENGSSLGVAQGTARPVAVSVNVQGSASARYVDAETGQMTITSVYSQ